MENLKLQDLIKEHKELNKITLTSWVEENLSEIEELINIFVKAKKGFSLHGFTTSYEIFDVMAKQANIDNSSPKAIKDAVYRVRKRQGLVHKRDTTLPISKRTESVLKMGT